jgi:hypothetical protein
LKRYQRGFLRKEKRARGEVWVYRFRQTRHSDGKRVERNKVVGPVGTIGKSEGAAWKEVERLHMQQLANEPEQATAPTFPRILAGQDTAAASTEAENSKQWRSYCGSCSMGSLESCSTRGTVLDGALVVLQVEVKSQNGLIAGSVRIAGSFGAGHTLVQHPMPALDDVGQALNPGHTQRFCQCHVLTEVLYRLAKDKPLSKVDWHER